MPDWIRFVRNQLNPGLLPPDREAQIVEEIARQMEDAYQEALRSGSTEVEAEQIAQQHIPDWGRFADELRSPLQPLLSGLKTERRLEATAAKMPWLASIAAEWFRGLLSGWRFLYRNPRFSILSILTIALGIGATTAIFTVIHHILLKPLPYDHPERIVWIWGKFTQGDRAAVSPPDFLDFRSQSASFEQIAAMHVMHQFVPLPQNLATPNGPVRFQSSQVTAGFFEVFGARARLGRTFNAEDEKGSRAVILSYGAWQDQFGKDPNIIGKSLTLNGTPTTVVGVAEKGFSYPPDTDMWIPISFASPEMAHRQFHFLRPIARLKQGVAMEKGSAELATIAGRLERQYPETNKSWTVRLQPFTQQIVGEVRKPLFVIFAAICFLLLIACSNVANLLLAKTTTRQKEFAVRLALGAGRGGIVLQMLAENLMFVIPASAIGFLLAFWSLESLKKIGVDFLPRFQEVQVDFWALAFATGCCLLTTILVSLAPALTALPTNPGKHLKDARYPAERSAAGRLRRVLAILEIAISLVLLAGAGLLLKSFWNLTQVKLGFDPGNLLTVRISLDDKHYPSSESVIAYINRVADKIGRLPGVTGVSMGTGLPLVPAGGDRFFTIDGRPSIGNSGDKPDAQFRCVGHDYFRTLGITVLQGRGFSLQDNENSRKVVVINEALAKEFFPNENSIGRFITIDEGDPFHAEIIGIVTSTRQTLAEPAQPEMYVLFTQDPMAYMLLAMRFAVPPENQVLMVQSALREIDHDMTFPKFRTMDQIIADQGSRNRLNAIFLSSAAFIALLLAAIGIYGVLTYSVEQRRHELGVRLALGADPQRILHLILSHAAGIAVTGLVAGIAGALLLTRLLRSLLYEVTPADPATLIAVSLLMFGVAIVACWIPARRAMKVDPLATLRYE